MKNVEAAIENQAMLQSLGFPEIYVYGTNF